MIPWFGLVIMLGLAAFFYKAADFEDLPHPMLWAGLSIFLYIGAVHGLHWGICGALSLQMLLFAGMTCYLALVRPKGVFSIGELRKRSRLRHNKCPGCSYDLQGIRRPGKCPECGADIPEAGA